MNKKIDLTLLLKDCPKGMELDCTMYENVTFVEVCKDTNTLYPIYCITTDENGNRSGCFFTKNGYASPRNSAKCVIFPKGKTTWEGFQRPFVDGDIIYNRLQKRICIYYYRKKDETPCISHCRYNEYHKTFEILDFDICIAKQDYRLATEEEKAKLFKALKDKGYKWDSETKTLEKVIEPKFKVGDRIISIENEGRIYTINGVYNSVYGLEELDLGLPINEQDNWELVPNKFDPKTLQPFDKVLGKLIGLDVWHNDFYSHYDKDSKYPYMCTSRGYKEIIPYNDDTKHLIGKTDEAPEFYKYWEN